MKKLILNYLMIHVVLILLNIIKLNEANLTCDKVENEQRFDCFPEYGSNEQECLKRGCCWRPPTLSKKTLLKHLQAELDIPYCFYPKDFPNYQVVNKLAHDNGYVYSIQKNYSTFRPNEILKLETKISFDTKERLRIQILDPSKDRYQVPVFNYNYKNKMGLKLTDETDYQIYVNENPFWIKVFRKSSGRIIFDTSLSPLIYADQYLEFSTSLTNKYFYGIGEHRDNLAHQAKWNGFTLWNRDISPTINTNLYGTHPFYMSIDEIDGSAMGFYLLNSNGMDINVHPNPALTFITIGGVLDFYIYLGPTPADVIAQHTEIVGRSLMPQYFTLGFHLCRWKYNNSTNLRQVIQRTRATQIPYDVQWTDIDAMSQRLDWTYDTANFSDLPDIVRDLHEHGQYYVNIIDPAISNTPDYYPYESGLDKNVFIKPIDKDEPLVGIVWPGTTVFPDFTNPNTSIWWTELASKFHEKIPYDGIWIDMNEPSNFLDGSVDGCTDNNYDEPPYVPKVLGGKLSSRTVCPSARQYLSNHYNLHNMYGHFEAIATNNALRSINRSKRPFILTRSSFGGTGQYSAHWSGDNRATWDDLYYSIPNMLNFNMFGISQVGSDICGFSGDTTEELCVRWMQLGAFYPFMRNHNDDLSKDQDPGVFSLNAQDNMRKVVQMRYSLLPYWYTLFYKSNQFGETVVRPLFFEYPLDKYTHQIDKQFLVGPALLITPVLERGADKVQGYLPNDTWYKYTTGERVNLNEKAQYVSLDAPLSEINVHLRSGYIIPIQFPSLTTKQSRKNPFGLVIGLKQVNNKTMYAEGSLFWDDGESLDSIDTEQFNYFKMIASDDSLEIHKLKNGYQTPMILSNVKVYGVYNQPNLVKINKELYDNFIYDDINNVLIIQYFQVDLTKYDLVNITWEY